MEHLKKNQENLSEKKEGIRATFYNFLSSTREKTKNLRSKNSKIAPQQVF